MNMIILTEYIVSTYHQWAIHSVLKQGSLWVHLWLLLWYHWGWPGHCRPLCPWARPPTLPTRPVPHTWVAPCGGRSHDPQRPFSFSVWCPLWFNTCKNCIKQHCKYLHHVHWSYWCVELEVISCCSETIFFPKEINIMWTLLKHLNMNWHWWANLINW